MTAAYFNLRGRYRSLGQSFRILPTVPQPTSAEFILQITFRILHFRKLPTPANEPGGEQAKGQTGNGAKKPVTVNNTMLS